MKEKKRNFLFLRINGRIRSSKNEKHEHLLARNEIELSYDANPSVGWRAVVLLPRVIARIPQPLV
jgi:hypothetical protein